MINPDWYLNIDSSDYANPKLLAIYDKTVTMAQDMIDFNMTVRQTAKEYCVGKSTVSRWIEKYLKFLDNDLYHEVKHELKIHKKHTRCWRKYI